MFEQTLMLVFSTMFKLHYKGKENLKRIQDLVEDPSNIVKQQVEKNEELTKLIREKYLVQKKIDSLIEELFMKG